jgi:SpoU rRNA methylase family enzyme
MTEAERLREQAYRLEAIRTWLQRVEGTAMTDGWVTMAAMANRVESEILIVEDAIAETADRLDPPPTRLTGQAWIRGLSVPVVRP